MSCVYIIDASSLIEMKDKYPKNIFPSVWSKMEGLYKQERLIAPEEVKEELLDDELKNWIKDKKDMFIKPDDEQMEIIKEILGKFSFLAKPEKPGGPNADPWIIALAIKLKNQKKQGLFNIEYIIVTEESKKSPNKIPAVARHYGIECVNLKELFEREGWKF